MNHWRDNRLLSLRNRRRHTRLYSCISRTASGGPIRAYGGSPRRVGTMARGQICLCRGNDAGVQKHHKKKQKVLTRFAVSVRSNALDFALHSFHSLHAPMKNNFTSRLLRRRLGERGFFNLRVLIACFIILAATFSPSSPRHRKYGLNATMGPGMVVTLPMPLPLTAQAMSMLREGA